MPWGKVAWEILATGEKFTARSHTPLPPPPLLSTLQNPDGFRGSIYMHKVGLVGSACGAQQLQRRQVAPSAEVWTGRPLPRPLPSATAHPTKFNPTGRPCMALLLRFPPTAHPTTSHPGCPQDKGGPLRLGPVWDYNEAYGMCCGYPIAGHENQASTCRLPASQMAGGCLPPCHRHSTRPGAEAPATCRRLLSNNGHSTAPPQRRHMFNTNT